MDTNKRYSIWTVVKVLFVVGIFVSVICIAFARYIFGAYTFSRSYGGDSVVTIESNRKVLNVTWKGDSLWILTREMNPSDEAESYTYREYSNFSILEGEIIVKEIKK